MKSPSRLPTFFISHGGGPWPYMESQPKGAWDKMALSLKEFTSRLNHTPKAILMISAHWETKDFTVNTGLQPPLLYDYSGFPEHTYHLKYDAPGSPELANQAKVLLNQSGFKVGTDATRGYDHGVFVPLSLMFPKADIPIAQLSIQSNYDPESHLKAGSALEKLRDEGVLIIGSGLSYHNMRGFGERFGPISDQFDDWLTEAVESQDIATRNEKLIHWEAGNAARLAHPYEDHLIPLMMVAGAAGSDLGKRIFSDHIMGVRMSNYQFG